MIIDKPHIATIAGRFLETLEDNGLTSWGSIIKSRVRRFEIRADLPDYLQISVAPSNSGTRAYKTSYVSPGFEGIPLETVLNPSLRYTQIIAKCRTEIPGYRVFRIDDYGNFVHFKKMMHTDWEEYINEIGFLSKLG